MPNIYYTKESNVQLAQGMLDKVNQIGQKYHAVTKKMIHITSGNRTRPGQAQAMYTKFKNNGSVKLYSDQKNAQEIKDAYDKGIKEHKNESTVVKAMTDVIDSQVRRSAYISYHLVGRAVDIRKKGMTSSEIEAFRKAVQGSGARLLNEGEPFHWHLQW
ncbi:MAG TPA: hypothetical protein VK791_09855 [bacterium]|nr:hypothetical protein [bacterium]